MPKSLAREGRVHFPLRKTKQHTAGMLLEFRNIRKVGLKAYGIKLSNQEHCAWPFQNAIIAKALTNSVRSITYFCYLCEFHKWILAACNNQAFHMEFCPLFCFVWKNISHPSIFLSAYTEHL